LSEARSSARAADQSHHRETAQTDDGGDFFAQLASHWKKNYSGWSAWMLTPDLKLPSKMRLKESRRVPMWNGPIECRLFRFDMIKGSLKRNSTESANDSLSGPSSPANATS
jgi:putative N6-adenine-specific DNA methylase